MLGPPLLIRAGAASEQAVYPPFLDCRCPELPAATAAATRQVSADEVRFRDRQPALGAAFKISSLCAELMRSRQP